MVYCWGSYKPCNHPNPPTPSRKKVTPTHTLPKKNSCPPNSNRKSMEKKVSHYPLGNQIYQKLKKC